MGGVKSPACFLKGGAILADNILVDVYKRQVFLLIDIRHDPSANDKLMYDWIVNNGYKPIIIATKLDKLKRSQVQKNVKAIKDGLKLRPGSRIIPFSAETKQGRDEILSLIHI